MVFFFFFFFIQPQLFLNSWGENLTVHFCSSHQPSIRVVMKPWLWSFATGWNWGTLGAKPLQLSWLFFAPQGQENKLAALFLLVKFCCLLSNMHNVPRSSKGRRAPRSADRLVYTSRNQVNSCQHHAVVLPTTETLRPQWGSSERGGEGRGWGLCWGAGWRRREKGGGEGGHWMWKPVWLISNREAGGGATPLSCSQSRLLARSSSGPQPHRTMRALQA